MELRTTVKILHALLIQTLTQQRTTVTLCKWRSLFLAVILLHLSRRWLTFDLGKLIGLTMQLVAVLILVSQTPAVVILLTVLAYIFGFMEGVISLLYIIRK